MALEPTFRALVLKMDALQEELGELRRAIAESKPSDLDLNLVDQMEDGVEIVLGWQSEVFAAAVEAQRAVGYPINLDRTRRALAVCHERFNQLVRDLPNTIMPYERNEALMQLVREHGGDWLDWAQTVVQVLQNCEQRRYEASTALLHGWI